MFEKLIPLLPNAGRLVSALVCLGLLAYIFYVMDKIQPDNLADDDPDHDPLTCGACKLDRSRREMSRRNDARNQS